MFTKFQKSKLLTKTSAISIDFFNYIPAADNLPLKTSTSFSESRNWRSRDRNYKVTLANFLEIYFDNLNGKLSEEIIEAQIISCIKIYFMLC